MKPDLRAKQGHASHVMQEEAVNDARFIAIFNTKLMRNCVSCQARARKEYAFRQNTCMRYIHIAYFKIHTCQTAMALCSSLMCSCRLQNVLPEICCQKELIMYLSSQAEWVLIQTFHILQNTAGSKLMLNTTC
ncbi:TPA: hypothetical protein ACH3X1_007603 [Trebouxia sp. C0004]